jgi:hypothetical protein
MGLLIGGQYSTMGSATMTYSPATWVSWNTVYTAGSTVTNAQVWEQWNTPISGTVFTGNQMTEAQIEEYRAAAKKIDTAKQRAEEFLLENLSPEQRESYRKDKLFIVETPKKNRYVLHASQSPRKIEGDKPVVSYCIHTLGVPREDELLGFKLLLEGNEDEFLKTANATALAA